MSQIKLYQEDLLTEVLWEERTGKRIAFGPSKEYCGFSFVTDYSVEIFMLSEELRELYLVLKDLFRKGDI